jgi:septal ring factor EnvC (AmiA/AmiB activator)
MQTNDPFLPQTLNQWLTAVGILVGWTIVAWRFFTKLSTDINRVGERTNAVETSCTSHGTEITNLKLEQQRSADDRGTMRERIAASEKEIETLGAELREERLAVMSMLHANERAAAERDAQTREQLARISERLNIERMVQSVVRNMKRDGNAEN